MEKERIYKIDEREPRRPFTVPEGYFDNLTQNIMAALPEHESLYSTKITVTPWMRIRPYLYAAAAFAGIFDRKYIAKWQRTFYQRFFAQQFKRNCAPDCPNATQFSFVQWHMASDLYSALWLEEMDKLMAE